MNFEESMRKTAPEGKFYHNRKIGITESFALTILCPGAKYAAAGTESQTGDMTIYYGVVPGYLSSRPLLYPLLIPPAQ